MRRFSARDLVSHRSVGSAAGALVAAVLAACAPHASPPSSAAPPAPQLAAPVASTTSAAIDPVPPPREDGRLPATAIPRRYALALTIDPAQERFQGQVTIDVDLPVSTSHVVLHGRDLSVHDLKATTAAGTSVGTAIGRISHGGVTPEELVLTFSTPLPAGRAALSITYDAPFDRELSGVYRVKDGERWYAFTQFESTAARRGFPCFDEPGYKVPFDVQVTIPKGMIAVANSPEVSRTDAALQGTRFEFATTPPLPTYLLAFAIGDFDVREGAKSPVPIRLITVKGKARLGDGALGATAGLVKKLGEYFALPYPFAKLDVVAVPDFAAGAMENPGLVTFREEIVLLDPLHTGIAAKRLEAVVIAHELAHMWFGDLVTMKWWNDVWLNEGFATWMETKATDAWHPDYATELDAITQGLGVMNTDALASARLVRQPVTSTSEIEEAFDAISYEKGASVLRMIERWIGPEAMQRGVRDYIRAHAWKNAEAADLLGALDHASARDVSGMAATFLDRSGVPTVTITSTCDAGKLTIGLKQASWRPLGVMAAETDGTRWRVPVCVRLLGAAGAPHAAADTCTELSEDRGALEITAPSCPLVLLPNADQAGYYRVTQSAADLRALARNRATLDVPGRIGFLSDLWAQVRTGELSPDVVLDVLPAFDHDLDSHVVEQVVAILESLDQALIDETTRMPFRGYVASRLGWAKQRLGWEPKEGEPGDAGLARSLVLEAMGRIARDPATLREASAVAGRWLKDPASVDAEAASVAIPLASIQAGTSRLDELRAAAKNAKTPLERSIARDGLGAFSDKELLERVWNLALTDEVRQQDALSIFASASAHNERARRFFPWLQAHWDAAKAKAPAGYQAALVSLVASACTKDQLDVEIAYLRPRAKELEGAMRPLAENEERATACAALRARGEDAVTKYFRKNARR